MKIHPRPLIAAFILTAASTSGAGLTQAQTVSPNPAPTIITSAPYTISQPGYYQLGANLTVSANTGTIIAIASGNVTLDFAGHYISGPADPTSTLVGVSATEKGNIVVQNGTVAYCQLGILLSGNGTPTSLNINQRVQNMLVSHCYVTGIEFTSASNSVISGNRISFIGGASNSASAVVGIYDNAGVGNVADGNIVTSVTNSRSGTAAVGIAGRLSNSASSLTVSNNRISNVTNSSNTPDFALGIYEGAFVFNNTVNNVNQGIYTEGKYSNNLTLNCTTPLAGGTNVGGNN